MSEPASEVVVQSTRKRNPYVGARAFRIGELYFGRELESAGLLNKLLPGGVLLLYSPSGAGKTSMIQASVVPEFRDEGFQICAVTKPRFAALRVNLPPPKDLDIGNRYVFSVVNGLVGHLVDRGDAARMTIEDALDTFARLGPPPGAEVDADTVSDEQARGSSAGSNDKDPDAAPTQQLVVIDQLEEALTIKPSDVDGQKEFFRQLGLALRRGRRWGLLAMREDHMGGIDQFKRFFQNELRTTYRIDLLDEASALRAVQRPAEERGVTFTDEAARRLVSDLRQVRADRPPTVAVLPSRLAGPRQRTRPLMPFGRSGTSASDGGASGRASRQAPGGVMTRTTDDQTSDPTVSVRGVAAVRGAAVEAENQVVYPYVEPVLLQVICESLWRILSKDPKGQFDTITVDDLEKVKPYNTTLSNFYRSVVKEASGKDLDVQRVIRDWIDQELLTEQGTRRPTLTLPPLTNQREVMQKLQHRYLIRDDPRPGGAWWELAHDMLVQPIIEDNRAWRSSKLKPWQVVAEDWHRTGRPDGYLLKGVALKEAELNAKKLDLTPVEVDFLDESHRIASEEGRLADLEYQLIFFRVLIAISVLANILLVLRLSL